MSKRPLCGAALLWAVMLWLLGQMQVSAFTFQTPKLPLKIPLEKAAVSGEIYKKEEFTLYTNLYIKNANLTINSKQYSIDNVKVHIKKRKVQHCLSLWGQGFRKRKAGGNSFAC